MVDIQHPARPGEPVDGRPRVLCVEDNLVNARLIEKVLGARPGLRFDWVASGEAAVASATATPPQLVLMDVNLPGIDGATALARLRAHPATSDVPVVAVTSNAMLGDEARGIAAGFDAYVTKPIDVVEFLALVDRMVAVGDGAA